MNLSEELKNVIQDVASKLDLVEADRQQIVELAGSGAVGSDTYPVKIVAAGINGNTFLFTINRPQGSFDCTIEPVVAI